MDERVIHLEDETTVEAKVNFATLYYIEKFHLDKLLNKKKLTADENLELTAKMLHVILLSNGRKCDFDEALTLLPIDDMELMDVIDDFADKVNDYKKKQAARAAMKQQQ